MQSLEIKVTVEKQCERPSWARQTTDVRSMVQRRIVSVEKIFEQQGYQLTRIVTMHRLSKIYLTVVSPSWIQPAAREIPPLEWFRNRWLILGGNMHALPYKFFLLTNTCWVFAFNDGLSFLSSSSIVEENDGVGRLMGYRSRSTIRWGRKIPFFFPPQE